MSIPLPPEIFDLIIDHLREDRATLKVCCVVSESWVARTRRHLFARIQFTDESLVKSWMKTFPDPSNSPAHHTRNLWICSTAGVTAATTVAHAWIRTFCNIVRLTVDSTTRDDSQILLAPLRALSPTLKSFFLIHGSIPSPEVFNFICSFPSLENLSLISTGGREADISTLPSTSPRFTGSLFLVMAGGIRSNVCKLIALPGGLHFTTIQTGCLPEDLESITTLVSACCNTLESLTILQYFPSRSSKSVPLDLSKATNLKTVVFQVGKPSVRWIFMTLQTIKSKNLQNISIHQETGPYEMPGVDEELLPEWQDLDRLLVQFWTSHSVRPKLVDAMKHLRDIAPTLLPELTGRGLLDIV